MDLNTLKRRLTPLFKEHKIEKAILFGSLARDEASHGMKQADGGWLYLEQARKLIEGK